MWWDQTSLIEHRAALQFLWSLWLMQPWSGLHLATSGSSVCLCVRVYLWCSWKTALCFNVFLGKKSCWSWSWYFSSTAQRSFFCWGLVVFWCVCVRHPASCYLYDAHNFSSDLCFCLLLSSLHRMTREYDLTCGFPLLVLWNIKHTFYCT